MDAGRIIAASGRRLVGILIRILIVLLVFVVLALAVMRLLAALRETDTAHPTGTSFIATPAGRIAAAVSGPADGPAILLVHGTAAWSGFWRDVADHLAQRGFRVIAADLPPFGYSDHDPQARYDRITQAERLSALLHTTAQQPAVVVGHSFGAGAATELALRHSEQVRRLILVDAALGQLDPPQKASSSAAALFGTPLLGEPLTAATLTNPSALRTLLRSMIARKDMADRWLPILREPMRRVGTTGAYAAWLPALFTADDGAYSRRSARLTAIRVPTALIWGEADTVTPLSQGERIARLTHAQSFIHLPGVGHIPHIEDPAGFLAALDASIDHKKDK